MTHLDPFLVGVDGSHASSAAIQFAAHEARRLGIGLRLVHVVPNYVPITPMFPLVASDLEESGREILAAATAEAGALLGPDRVTSLLLDGSRVTALVEAAEHARAVILGAEQRPVIERLLTGSTLFGVAARAQCPVVAVPRDWIPAEELHSIVAGVKSTQHSRELVRRALEVAAERGAGVVLVHAWELPNEYDDLITARVDKEEWSDRARAAIERSLEGLRDAYPGVPVEIRVVHGQPARVLQRASDGADLLLLARRRSGFPFGHLGGTVRALLREGHRPVEVVPPADEPDDTSVLDVERVGTLEK